MQGSQHVQGGGGDRVGGDEHGWELEAGVGGMPLCTPFLRLLDSPERGRPVGR